MGKYFDRHFTRKLCQWQLCYGNMLTIINYKRNKRLQLDAITHSLSFPDGSAGKESACSAGDTGYSSLISALGRSPGVGNDNPLYPIMGLFRQEKPGKRSQVGCSPKGCRESDMTERLSTLTLTSSLSD